jgi:glyoxylase-like metal-dependent hydrolase (beta-lactamase superfamily II)
MVEEIRPNLFRIEVPLANSPLKSLNSYVIKSSKRSLIIDTGWNHRESLDAMKAGLRQIGVDIDRADFFITHLHSDHLGLVSHLASPTSNIYFNKRDADHVHSGIDLNVLIDFARLNGYPEKELQAVPSSHPGFKFKSEGNLIFQTVSDGDHLSVGEFTFRCIETPGHTKGHTCLYDPSTKILISGDHILKDITPTISLWSDAWNPLRAYLASLEKIRLLPIDLVLPGHRSVFSQCHERIAELELHHRKRLDEIVAILRTGEQTAYEVASHMTWDIVCESWDLFPVSQKWFATGEAIAHLKYLEEEGTVLKNFVNGQGVFSLGTSNR